MFDVETIKTITASGAGGVLVLLCLYFFRDAVLSALNRSAQRDIEARKAELQKDLEKWKSDLEREKERYRHDLARDAAKIAMFNEKSHELYAQIFESLRRAEGAVGRLHNIYFSPDWKTISAEAARAYFTERGASIDSLKETLSEIDSNRDSFAKKANSLDERLRLFNTDKAIDDFKNLVLLKELYLSEKLNKKLTEVRNLLYGAVSGFAPYAQPGQLVKSHEKYRSIKPLIEEIRDLMQAEIRGA